MPTCLFALNVCPHRFLMGGVAVNRLIIEDIDQQITLNESRLSLEDKAIAFFTVLSARYATQFFSQADSSSVDLDDSVVNSLVPVELLPATCAALC